MRSLGCQATWRVGASYATKGRSCLRPGVARIDHGERESGNLSGNRPARRERVRKRRLWRTFRVEGDARREDTLEVRPRSYDGMLRRAFAWAHVYFCRVIVTPRRAYQSTPGGGVDACSNTSRAISLSRLATNFGSVMASCIPWPSK